MKLKINETWECFSTIEKEIADFSIITGINGVGKTMLLSAISYQSPANRPNPTYLTDPPVKLVDSLDNEILSIKYFPIGTLEPRFTLNSTEQPGRLQFNYARNPLRDIGRYYEEYIKTGKKENIPNGFYKVAEKVNKDVCQLSWTEIEEHYLLSDGDPTTDIFSERIGELVGYYAKLKHDNTYNAFENLHEGAQHHVLTPEEFIEKRGQDPAKLINDIFKLCNLPYEVRSVKIYSGEYFNVYFINTNTGSTVQDLKLSSGEKILLSIALSVYKSERGNLSQSKLLLLDEPDASLHPSNIKKLLDALETVFINNGISVVMTTHSPSTIALAPESATIYLLEKDPTTLTPLSKDNAISKLTAGIPTLSVRIENRRFVFVESTYDVKNLETLFNKLRPYLQTHFSLTFITSEKNGSSSCDKVEHLLDTLIDVPTVFGVIDHDGSKTTKGNLAVLGFGSRYAIENYILDPVILGAFLVQERILLKQFVGLTDEENHTAIVTFDNTRLQIFSDLVVRELFEGDMTGQLDGNTTISKYVNGRSILIPNWFSTNRGHDVEEFVKKRFPQLKRYHNTNSLFDDILSKTIEDMPGLILEDIRLTMEYLCSR
ncbi:AAA family ATPase [Spirosoma endophyticum]|uniref:ATPase/GTPase, AAA15 family n=1 Tax=Spirosoma endophyticum TaxID=662367 RepID=A0A1I2DGX9_9BACT|nr:ATP-binding protein [Spirosoma endophyticum]SFE79698.1 ATPase/GTPase, AAA15 family [Spirosoma endophyticum]